MKLVLMLWPACAIISELGRRQVPSELTHVRDKCEERDGSERCQAKEGDAHTGTSRCGREGCDAMQPL
jgi:hypothetical protein